MSIRTASLAAFALCALPSLAAAEKPVTPTQLLQRALAPVMAPLAACGAPAKSIATFGIGFDGRVQNVRIDGVAPGSAAHGCVARELGSMQVPVRLAYIVREIKLPLPSNGSGGSASR